MKNLLLILLLIAYTVPVKSVSSGYPSRTKVFCWKPHDFSFTANVNPVNSFLVPFSALLTGPNGISFTIPGFYDGNNTWIIRVSPNVEGKWRLVTKSGIPELDGKTISFICVKNSNPKIHGVLRVDKKHPHHFIFDDGTRFFMQGYEYDWLWALDMDKTGVPTVDKTLDLISGYGFNSVILNSFAYDTKWCLGISESDDYGPSLLYPWEGDHKKPIQDRMNIKYWQHYDKVINALYERGIQAHIFIKVYSKLVKWPAQYSPEEKMFFEWLMARYSAYPNIIWDFSKEAHHEENVAYKQYWLKYIRSTDPYHHLVTIHDDDKANESGLYDELTDFRTDQQHKNFRETLLRQRARRDWPVVNAESDYECGPGGVNDRTSFGRVFTAENTLRTLWEIAMAGGYTVYYYTYTAWDIIHPFDVPPGYKLMKHFGDFWRSTNYWLLKPVEGITSKGWCLADEGSEYVVYLNDAKPFTLEIKRADKPLSAEWFNPFSNKKFKAGTLINGTANLTPPTNWGDAPVVFYCRVK